MKTFDKVILLPQFQKDLKKLCKRFKTLEDDLKTFIKTELVLFHKLKKDNKGVFHIPDLEIDVPKIYKAKKFASRSLKGKGVQSGFRVIYAHFKDEDRIELIEIYYKGNKKREDRNRIMKHYRKDKK